MFLLSFLAVTPIIELFLKVLFVMCTCRGNPQSPASRLYTSPGVNRGFCLFQCTTRTCLFFSYCARKSISTRATLNCVRFFLIRFLKGFLICASGHSSQGRSYTLEGNPRGLEKFDKFDRVREFNISE